eukprot:jgi/Chrzof1/12778/Cz07g07080.t1_CRUP[v5.2]
MFDRVDALAATAQAGGAGGRTTYQAFKAADDAWYQLRHMKTGAEAGPAPKFVTTTQSPLGLNATDFDVVVCGGTLGIFMAAALSMKGWRVGVIERGPLRGRAQEWNISRKEMEELVELGLLSATEAEECIAMEFNPVRVGFHGGDDVWTRDVLNLGVKPDTLIQKMRAKLEAHGGRVYENAIPEGVQMHPDAASLTLRSSAAAGGATASTSGSSDGHVSGVHHIRTRLVLDCMGHASPIVKQIRWGQRPDGVCLVVGGCAAGFDPHNNTTADIIYTNSHLQPAGVAGKALTHDPHQTNHVPLQYFWEAFPAADPNHGSSSNGQTSGHRAGQGGQSSLRTTYMFTYADAQSWRPSLEMLMEDYWRLMPEYQGLPNGLEGLTFVRLLFGFFPTFKNSPLKPGFDRVLQIGDASGIQSPLSFGGFGALTRHLRRLTTAVHEALTADALSKSELSLVNPYNPGLSSAWMLQRAMTAVRHKDSSTSVNEKLINKMLAGNFSAMKQLGEPVMKPFLQDVIKFGPLLRTMAAQVVLEPLFVPKLMTHVGLAPLADWLLQVGALGVYSGLHFAAAPPLKYLCKSLNPKQQFQLKRTLEAWEYGSGNDYKL